MSHDSIVDERKNPLAPASAAGTLSPFALVALVQAVVYVATGIWPFASMRTFLLVTGPKVDLWLVKTVGALVTVIGAVIGLTGIRRQRSPEVALLAIGSAAMPPCACPSRFTSMTRLNSSGVVSSKVA